MTYHAKGCWALVLLYGSMLCLSLVVFLVEPNPHPGSGEPMWNAVFQLLGPTLGTLIFVVALCVQILRARISLVSGLIAILFLVAISILCLVLAGPILMSV